MSGYEITIDLSDLIRGIDAEVERKTQQLSEAVGLAATALVSERASKPGWDGAASI
jgi:hypothetical protein